MEVGAVRVEAKGRRMASLHVFTDASTAEKERFFASYHDNNNVRPHVAKPVKAYLETLKWKVLPDPPYSPDNGSTLG